MKEKYLNLISVCVFEDVSGVCEDTAAALHFPEQSSLPVVVVFLFVCFFCGCWDAGLSNHSLSTQYLNEVNMAQALKCTRFKKTKTKPAKCKIPNVCLLRHAADYLDTNSCSS